MTEVRGQMTEDRKQRQKTEGGGQMAEVRGQMTEVRGQMSEDRGQKAEVGSGTRRRPIERDYAAAKDAEVGEREKTESRRQKSEDR